MLYQNKEQNALEQIQLLFEKLNSVTTELMKVEDEDTESIVLYVTMMYQNLIDAYKHKDMLGMADCLQAQVSSVIELYRIKCQVG